LPHAFYEAKYRARIKAFSLECSLVLFARKNKSVAKSLSHDFATKKRSRNQEFELLAAREQ
jgi:hypothetical protein